MQDTFEKAVVFVDLSSSTTLFEAIGDKDATGFVRRITSDIATHLQQHGGKVLKFLGDGVMAIFDEAEFAVRACLQLGTVFMASDALSMGGVLAPDHGVAVRVGIDYGAVIEVDNDAYGDIVNVASRLLTLAKPGELLLTAAVYTQLAFSTREGCRRLGRVFLRGKSSPELIYGLNLSVESSESGDITQFNDTGASVKHFISGDIVPSIELQFGQTPYFFGNESMPVTIGRSSECDLVVPDNRVSRTHVRLDWFDGQFYLTDISINGTMVQYGTSDLESSFPLSLRRQRCALSRDGYIILGLLDRHKKVDESGQNMPPFLRFSITNKKIGHPEAG